MDPHPVYWHHVLALVALAIGLASALVILVDEFVRGHRQHMWVMNLVHPITALYWGPVWVWAYVRYGRRMSVRLLDERAAELAEEGADPDALRAAGQSTERSELHPWHIANAVSHCGAGCTLGDILAEWVVFVTGITWFGTWSGHKLPEELALDFIAAWAFGVPFQYFTILPMRGDGPAKSLWTAIKVDTASIVSFQVGLFGWLAIVMLVIWPHHGISIASADFWFQMQIGMMLGFLTAWSVNHALVNARVKEKMDYRTPLSDMLEQRYSGGS